MCGLGETHVPSCTQMLIAVTRTRARVKSPADLFAGNGDLMTVDDAGSAKETHLQL